MVSVEGKKTPAISILVLRDRLLMLVKANKLAKEYEKQGGGYENEAGSKNEPKKGEPQAKSESKKKAETS